MITKVPSLIIPIVPHPRYNAADHYALLDGNARLVYNQVAHYFVCIPEEKIGRCIRKNDLVHLEQRRGNLVRTIVRKVEVRGRRFLFASLTNGGDTLELKDVAVRGLVVGKVVTHRV
jgi:hypothetical protein